jgi:hypothetical protein
MIRFAIGFLAAMFSVHLVASAQTGPEATLVDVELVLRGPDARPLDSKTAVITILDEPNLHLPDLIVTTDSHGIARFKLPAGVFRLGIKVRGIGYESTGATEFRVGSIARPELPPLAGYGAIDGFVPQTGCVGDVTVSAWSPYVGALTTQADASGRFHFDDLAGGRWFVLAYRGKDTGCHCSSGEYISVNVGEVTQGVKLTPLKYAPCWENPSSSAPPAAPTSKPAANAPVRLGHEVKSGSEVVWARGTVTDESGQPVQNATVFALGTFYGGIRMKLSPKP